MTHVEAQRDMSVERYLLGELQGDARDEFEDHLFDCAFCAADLRAGADFAEGLRATGPKLVAMPARPNASTGTWKTKASSWAASWLQPWIAAPALAACMGIIAVQSFVIQPRLHRELAEAKMPGVIDVVPLNGATRSLDATSEVQAHQGGLVYIALDIPAEPRFRSYRCTLISPAGKPVWHINVSPGQANDILTIKLPVGSTASGLNVLKVEGIPMAEGGQAVSLVQRSFRLKIGE